VKRREFIALIGGAAAWPLAANAQQSALPVVAFVRSEALAEVAYLVHAFRDGLKNAGFVEGQNVVVEYHSADGQYDNLPALVSDLIRRPASVIIGNIGPALAAKNATTTVPVVFVVGNDPIALGLVPRLNRPGGNLTGVFFFTAVLIAKRLEQLHALVPQVKKIGLLVDPNTNGERERSEGQLAAQASQVELVVFDITTEQAVDDAFARLAQRGVGAVIIGSGAFTLTRRKHIIAAANRYRLPASYAQRQAVIDGGLISYSPSISDAYRQAAAYTGRILKGEKAGDLPVMQSTKFELLLNLNAAKALGIDVPSSMLALADEVIE
jgi:putative tryptophan/tyrosine transport system substrate-binding protein